MAQGALANPIQNAAQKEASMRTTVDRIVLESVDVNCMTEILQCKVAALLVVHRNRMETISSPDGEVKSPNAVYQRHENPKNIYI